LKDLPTPKEIEDFGKAPLEMRGNIAIEPDEESASPIAGAEAAEQLAEALEKEAVAEEPVSEPASPHEPLEGPASADGDPEKKLDFGPGTP
jgi:hypothetical protein